MTAESITAILQAHFRRSDLHLTDAGVRLGGRMEESALREIVSLVIDAYDSPTPEGSGLQRQRHKNTIEVPVETIAHLLTLSVEE